MTKILNSTFLHIWADFSARQRRGELEALDDLSRKILYLVGISQVSGKKVNYRCVINEYASYTAPTIYGRIHKLVEQSWLLAAPDPDDGRGNLLTLSDRSLHYLNKLSEIIEVHESTAVRRRKHVVIDTLTAILPHATSTTLLFASALTSI